MKTVKKVLTHHCGYYLTLENGKLERIALETVVDKEGVHEFVGLKDMQILEEYLDVNEGKEKRLIFKEDRLGQIQEAYICGCDGTMVLVDYYNELFEKGAEECGGYYDVISTYECCKCKEKYRKNRRYINQYYNDEY